MEENLKFLELNFWNFRNFEFLNFWIFRVFDFLIFDFLNFWISEFLNFWIFEFLNFWIFEFPNFWISEFLNFFLIWKALLDKFSAEISAWLNHFMKLTINHFTNCSSESVSSRGDTGIVVSGTTLVTSLVPTLWRNNVFHSFWAAWRRRSWWLRPLPSN